MDNGNVVEVLFLYEIFFYEKYVAWKRIKVWRIEKRFELWIKKKYIWIFCTPLYSQNTSLSLNYDI